MINVDKMFYDHVHYQYDDISYLILFLRANTDKNYGNDTDYEVLFMPVTGTLIPLEKRHFISVGDFTTKADLGFERDNTIAKYYAAFEAARQGLVGPEGQYTAKIIVSSFNHLTSFKDDYTISKQIRKIGKDLREIIYTEVESKLMVDKCVFCNSENSLIRYNIPEAEEVQYECKRCYLSMYYNERTKSATIRSGDAIKVIEVCRGIDIILPIA